MVKFRSMVVRAEASGVDSTAGDDPRITAVGRLVRRFKLDELPQLWNVVWGEMSCLDRVFGRERDPAGQ
jgi:lipopolysaccharide/colanic/teichoic acid biosynthesis glycosyltransferase